MFRISSERSQVRPRPVTVTGAHTGGSIAPSVATVGDPGFDSRSGYRLVDLVVKASASTGTDLLREFYVLPH